MRTHCRIAALVSFTLLALAACGGGDAKTDSAAPATPAADAPAAAPSDTPLTPDAGGKVVTIEMLTDEAGNNIFRPATVEAKRGDVLRYTLVSGVHNVHFLPDSNAVKTGLPTASQMLQLPGQSVDIKVAMGPGTYYFQCDPHALLGMKGHLTVAQ
jgi:plastocyanin